MNIKLIGLGGIGSNLLPPLCRILASEKSPGSPVLTLIDGDAYEGKNADRQAFDDVGNKAEVSRAGMKALFPELEMHARPSYVSDENAFIMINDGDVVLMGVDNHATRSLVSRRCSELLNVTLISGGNELTDGNVQVHVRVDGADKTPPITYLHPEIAHPVDRNPADMSCEELAMLGSTQLLVTNIMAAALMLSAFRMVLEYREGRGALSYSEAYFDIQTGNVRSFLRRQEATSAKE